VKIMLSSGDITLCSQLKATEVSELCLLPASNWFLVWLIAPPCRNIAPKRRLTSKLHGIISQKTELRALPCYIHDSANHWTNISYNIIFIVENIILTRRVRFVAHMGETRNAYRILVGRFETRGHLEDLVYMGRNRVDGY
jgi:hypothetical protein